jgi:hypothetical protein
MLSLQAYLRRLIRLRVSRGTFQIAAALLVAAFAYQGFHLFDQSRANFDETVRWLGLALLCLAVVAWDGARPHPSTWPARLAAFLRRHWWELVLVLSIVGFAVFIRTFQFGEYPPSGLICCEEDRWGEDAFAILEGDRPLRYPMVKYSVAFGFLLFGENTMGLRFHLLLAGVLTVPVFYLLLRQLVRAPAALFATALLASAWPLVATEFPGKSVLLATVLFAYLMVLGIRRRNALALLGAGFLAGLLSYEYETWRVVPVVAGGFLTALAAYRLAYPLPKGARAFLARLRSLVATHWRPAVVFVGAALIALTPLLVAELQGEGLYFRKLQYHVDFREAAGTPGLIAPNWDQHLKWAAELFTSQSPFWALAFGARTFPYGLYIPVAPLVDPITATLLGMGVILAVVTFYRPFRLLFLAWYLVVLGGAVLGSDFYVYRFLGVLPAGFVLVAFVADDVGRVVGRWARGPGVYLLALLLLGGAIYVAYWNADTLSGKVATDAHLGRYGVYEEKLGPRYALCNYLQGRGGGNFSYVYDTVEPDRGFARPHETPEEQRETWGRLRWVCHDLRGQAIASPFEVWPMRDVPDGPLTWAFVIGDSTKPLAAYLGRVFPSKTEPDRIIDVSGDAFRLVAYELSGQELKAQQGLFGQYRSGDGGTLLAERVDDVRRVQWDDAQSGFSPPFTVQWRGLIYVPQASTAALTARTSDPTLITVDGQVSYSSLEEEAASFPQDLLPGWHPVEISLHKETPGGSFALEWVGPEGLASSIARQDLFALSSLAGWTHERTVERDGELTRTQRFDFTPYVSSAGVIELASWPATLIGESWSAVWHVQEGREYQLKLTVASEAATVKLDGATVLTLEAHQAKDRFRTAEAVVSVSAGDHSLEIEEHHDGGKWTGVGFTILALDVPDYAPEFSPY